MSKEQTANKMADTAVVTENTDSNKDLRGQNVYKEPATPSNWHWAITPQQVAEIKQGNRQTVNEVYFDNLAKLRRVCSNLCYKHRRQQFLDDCLQQIYIDLPEYNFKNVMTFFWGIKRSCYYAFGYRRYNVTATVSLDSPLQSKGSKRQEDAGNTLADLIGAVDVDENEIAEQDKRVLTILDSLTLSEQEKDVLTAVAFGCAVQRGLYELLRKQYK